MARLLVLVVSLLVLPAQAATEPRCGVDAFGNRVCIDRDGVVVAAPRVAADDQQGGKDKPQTAGDKGEKQQAPRRCGVDPFGNTVCQQ
jgi:hypothetical protein